jgi:alpha-1,6-mannosyltransferase
MPIPSSEGLTDSMTKRNSLVIYLLVLAGIIFRSELALLLATQLLHLLIKPLISLQTIIPIGLHSAAIALAISIPIDSYFWQRPIWPELASFFYNAIQGKSTDWGTSPFHAYFTSFLPKLLLNPMIPLLLIPSALYFPATRRSALGLVAPSLVFVAIYSLQPHKEARFIIYVVPPLTACASLGAHYIFTRRSRSLINRLLSFLIVISIVSSFAASTIMLGISSLNYPGGEALFKLHELVVHSSNSSSEQTQRTVNVHMDVLACMTGVSRFQQDDPTPPLSHHLTMLAPLAPLLLPLLPSSISNITSTTHDVPKTPPQIKYSYDKTEDPAALLDPAFWSRFDYVLAERPETVIGKWEVVDTVYGYAGMEVLRPGGVSRSGVEEGEEVGRRVWGAIGGGGDEGGEDGDERGGKSERAGAVSKVEVFREDVERMGLYGAVREGMSRWVTRGWWVGPRMEAKIRILKRVP